MGKLGPVVKLRKKDGPGIRFVINQSIELGVKPVSNPEQFSKSELIGRDFSYECSKNEEKWSWPRSIDTYKWPIFSKSQ